MPMPSADTPLYNHPLPEIEEWLLSKGCQQDRKDLHRWTVRTLHWEADLVLDIDSLDVRYVQAGENGRDIMRSFKYSLSRHDLEEVIFAGP